MFWLFNVHDGTYFKLNKTSYFILSCFDGKTSLSKIREKVLSQYIVEDLDEVSKDFEALFEKLESQEILEPVSRKGGQR